MAAPSTQPVAAARPFCAQAMQSVRAGDFGKTATLLKEASTLSPEESLQQMSEWATRYETQKAHFDAERKEQFDKAVKNIHILVDNTQDEYASDEVEAAHTLAFDKDEFLHESRGSVDLINSPALTAVDDDTAKGLWLKALRIDSDLAALEPTSPVWKDKLKMATRRVRLVMVYTPARLKTLQDQESKDRKAANDLHAKVPGRGHTSHPQICRQSSVPRSRRRRTMCLLDVDWHDVVKGVRWDDDAAAMPWFWRITNITAPWITRPCLKAV